MADARSFEADYLDEVRRSFRGYKRAIAICYIVHGGSYILFSQMRSFPWALAFMMVGIVASSFHLGVGIWNFLCKWGLAGTVRAQRAAGQLGAMVGIIFSCVGVLIVLSFRFDWHPFAGYLTHK